MFKVKILSVAVAFAIVVCLGGVSVSQASGTRDGAKAHKEKVKEHHEEMKEKCKDHREEMSEHHDEMDEKRKARHEEWENASSERKAEMKAEREAHWSAKSDEEIAHSCEKISKRCGGDADKPLCADSMERCAGLAK